MQQDSSSRVPSPSIHKINPIKSHTIKKNLETQQQQQNYDVHSLRNETNTNNYYNDMKKKETNKQTNKITL